MPTLTSSSSVSILYPLTAPDRERSPSARPPILCLGLPRTGTDSLCKALNILGYENTYHAFMLAARAEDCRSWVPLLEAKLRQVKRQNQGRSGHAKHDDSSADDRLLTTFRYESILGDTSATTDQPTCIFPHELLSYYPDSPVILNRRDLDDWHRSLRKVAGQTLFGFTGAVLLLLHFFDARFYWFYRTASLSFQIISKNGSFEKNGRKFAQEHYDSIEERLRKEGRGYLNWEAEDGWESLCRHLGREVPKGVEFPRGNKTGREFEENIQKTLMPMVWRALVTFFGLLVTAGVVAAGFVLGRRSFVKF